MLGASESTLHGKTTITATPTGSQPMHFRYPYQKMKNKTFIESSIEYLKGSYNNIVPSKDMSSDEYAIFLECAKPYEMELDVVSIETYYKICKELNVPPQKPEFPEFRYIQS